jgi:RHS repeat-associated protein
VNCRRLAFCGDCSAGGQSDNGNLLDDGPNTYTYDAANRLTGVTDGVTPSTYTYNGLGDRLSQTVDSTTTDYILDLNAGLVQVLDDGTNTYLYGNGRIGELQPGGFAYHMGDALGSVRQLADASGDVTLAKSYEPFGSMLTNVGSGSSTFAFTGEQFDAQTTLTYLRARYYGCDLGRFISKDTWEGSYESPLALNKHLYVEANPINFTDPTGHCPQPKADSGTVICVDLFIETSTIIFGLGSGDGRTFDSNSDPSQSRGYLYVYLDNSGKFVRREQYVNPSCFTFTTRCFGPYPGYNEFTVHQDPASLDITVTWEPLNGFSGFLRKDTADALWQEGHLICNILSIGANGVSYTIPSINGELTLGMKRVNRYSYQWYLKHLDRDPYPSLEIYYYFNGTPAYTIAQRGEWPLEHPEIGLVPFAPNDRVP